MNRKFSFVLVLSIITSLLVGGYVFAQDDTATAWVGIAFNMSDQGLVITRVVDESPAQAAGLSVGDIILKVNDEGIEAADELVAVVQAAAPEDTLTLQVLRSGEILDVDVTLGVAPEPSTDDNVRPFGNNDRPFGNRAFEGRMITLIPGAVVSDTDAGLEVIEVLPGDSELEVGDVVTAINGTSIVDMTSRDLMDLLVGNDNDTVELIVMRGDEELTIESVWGFDHMVFPDGGMMFGNMPMGNRVLLGVQYSMTDAGAQLTEVLPDSPADAAGLQVDDVVVSVNGDAITADSTLGDLISDMEAGNEVTLEVVRGDETIEVTVTLAEVAGFNFGDMMPMIPFDRDGRGGDFNFHFGMPGSGLQDFLDQFDIPLPEAGTSTTVECTNADGDTVFSFNVEVDEDGNTNFNVSSNGRNMNRLNLEDLNCQVVSDADGSDT